MKTKILSILALLLMTVTQGAWAQETLTVFNGTAGNEKIPMDCYDFDCYTKSECIIPASELTAMEGGTITAITFYAKTVGSMSDFGTANQKVFLKEVSETTLGYFSDMTGATVVFDGLLPMPTTTGGYTITFSQGYTYNGGNLLIGVYNDAKGYSNNVTWYGNNNQSDRVSAYGASGTSSADIGLSAQNFLPKTTFTYTPAPVQMFAGEGTEASPYLIASTTDWDNLSAAVNAGTEYSGIYFKLTANISVTTMIGASDKPFRGSFDGGGHTLTVNYTASTAGSAPFPRTASTTLIKNLRVAGTITGGDFKVAGLVSEPAGATIEHCRVSATISAKTYHGLWIGGFCNGGNVTINNCLFDGKINCVGGGFIGYSETTSRITNCLFAPQTGSSLGSSQDGNGVFIYTKGRESNLGTITNCYYTSLANGVAQGINGSGMSAAEHVNALGASNWKEVDGNAIPKVHPGLSGLGTEASPYLIASTTDWNNLVSAVNGGETYSGNYFKMTANVDASKMIGSSTETFKGNFDGDGYTLNLNINMTASSSQIAAPFAYVVGGTIKNVKLTGTVSTAGMRSSSLVGYADNCTIRNCTSSVAISTSRNNDIDGGAFVACVIANKTVTIEGCAFTGSITFSDAAGYEGGGFVGWMRSPSTVTLTNCLFAPSAVSLAKASPAFKMFAYDNAGTTLTLNNCYYNGTAACNEKITKQDGTMQMHTIAAGDYVSSLSVTKGSATATYDVSGITVYSGGIDFNDGSTTTFYGGSEQTVSLALTAETRSGYHFKQYAASQGTLSDETTNTPTLIMPAANSTANDAVTISAQYDPTYNADFADGNDNTDWTIDPTSGVAGTSVSVSYTGENKVKSVTVAPKGALTGKFSVSSTKQVQFSKGNLQYVGTWQFAANQYDIFGASQSDDHRDLFGWGTKTNPNNTSTTNGDYSWAEWGENTITNGCTGWRTLTKDEWGYLFTDRANASTLRTFATINNVTGLIVMPDGWTASGVTLTITTANYTTNVLSTSQWATLEKQGCVFLPAAGGRAGTNVVNVGSIGDYWSSDASGETNAYDLNFSNDYLLPQNTAGQRHYGWSVRLVRDVE